MEIEKLVVSNAAHQLHTGISILFTHHSTENCDANMNLKLSPTESISEDEDTVFL
jgi:hypothetical protein